MWITPSVRQFETSNIPDSLTTKKSFLRRLFRLPYIDEFKIWWQSSEWHCVVWSTLKMIEFSVNKEIPEGDVAQWIKYNNDKDWSPNLPAIVEYINENINDSGLKSEYFLNPQVSDVVRVIRSWWRVMANITSKWWYPHRVVWYDIEEDEDGKLFIIIHDSWKTYFDKDWRYVKTAAESRKVYEKYVSGSKRRIPIEIFQDMMDAWLTWNRAGSGVRRVTWINTVWIAIYNPECFDDEYLDELFSFSRSPMNQVLKTWVNAYSRSKEHPYGKIALEFTFFLLLVLRIGSLGIRTYRAAKWNNSSVTPNSFPEETTL
jgi:hypothetical protein